MYPGQVRLCLCLCHLCWAEVTWGTRSHRCVTALATPAELLSLQGTAWTCSPWDTGGLSGTAQAGMAETPLLLPIPWGGGTSLLHLPSTPPAHGAERALGRGEHLPRAAVNLTCGRAFLCSQLPRESSRAGVWILLGHSSST